MNSDQSEKGIGQEKVAYITKSRTGSFVVQIRDGNGLGDGIFSIHTRAYYDTFDAAEARAERCLSDGVDRIEYSYVVERDEVAE